MEKDLSAFMYSEVRIPQMSDAVVNGKDVVVTPTEQALARMVILYDSTVCGSCKISQIWQWQIVTDYAKVMQDKFEPIFIFAPTVKNEREVRMSLKLHPFGHPVFMDSEQKFLAANPAIPQNKALHTFLLDKNGKVVLVGEPLNNEKLWDLYKTTIKELVDNGGVLKQES